MMLHMRILDMHSLWVAPPFHQVLMIEFHVRLEEAASGSQLQGGERKRRKRETEKKRKEKRKRKRTA